ncbi:permease [Maribacter thermophilus]|uniref:permease n=1 Tax=Maribacter thermophilus TaxID=1197874 RepID=UPI0006413BF9|nr:permease [Maribacter thermophilus]
MNEKLTLALNEFIHVGVVLVLIIALVSVLTGMVRAFIPQEKLQKRLAKTGKYSGLTGALLGVPTPFCSASMVPVSMGMIEMGAPFSMVFSFLLSAPLANFVVVGFIFGVFGWKVALIYFLVVFLGAVTIGSVVGKTSLKNEVKRIDLTKKATSTTCPTEPRTNCENTASTCSVPSNKATVEQCTPNVAPSTCIQAKHSNTKLKEAFTFALALFKRIFPYVILGALISAISAIFVPDAWVQEYLGNNSPFAIPIAAVIGVPLYLRIEMAIPILSALIGKGMSMGAAMALIIGGTGASLPEIAIISSMLKPKAIIAFIVAVMAMAIVGGFIFYFLF